ncbi:MAG: nucleotide-binding protein [Desulfosporosinus sp.]|nr:nucleotide-binding protein [Desulfosporosinus sp.]
MKHRIFIGCSTENLRLAKVIQLELDHDAYTHIWTQDIFKLTSTALEDLLVAINKFDFAIFVFNPEDITIIRGEDHKTVRDNIIFELGLFLGRLNSRKKVFLLKPRSVDNLHLPSDLAGLMIGDYDSNRTEDLQASVAPFCTSVMNQIRELGNNSMLSLEGKWNERWCVYEYEKELEYFEDNNVIIEQFGDKISAKFTSVGRTYLFEGVIEQMRFITGSWRDIEVGPTYSGAFQLEIKINGETLYGRWVGFSATDNSIKTGIWEWKREGVKDYPSERKH